MGKRLVGFWITLVGLATAAAPGGEGLRIAESAQAVDPVGGGAGVPDAPLRRLDKTETTLHEALAGKPTILVVFRGGWCPYCTRHLVGLRAVSERLRGMGYQLIAVSPDTPESTRQAGEAPGCLK